MRLAKEAQQYGFKALVADLQDYDMDELSLFPKQYMAIFLLATYGEGEPTDNARSFYEYLMDDARISDFDPVASSTPSPLLANMNYVLFGLGNRTYAEFNATARQVDQRLLTLGARSLIARGEGDDNASLEDDFVKWKTPMWLEACSFFGVDPKDVKMEMYVKRWIKTANYC